MADRSQQTFNSPISDLQQDGPSSGGNVTHNSGAIFPGASYVTVGPSSTFQQINIHEAERSKENTGPTAPAGFTAGMTDLTPVSPFFTGRKAILSELETYFIVESPSTEAHEKKIFVLHGMGGAGKTQTALKFMSTFRKRFTQCYMINANSEESIMASYYDIALKNGLGEFSNWEAGLRWLSQHEEEWIFLYDNADDPDLDLGKFLPQSNHASSPKC
ncbi:hypothetical protein GYMLUDRAFT_377538 [Collybiopsis luxurians FD-317 M1]|uniref:NB-ARC domain-containing protein n=1 Tax=Collybiopsis luxurians FD-317 M1 TaxID=944289 RepID=A0A0D0CA90_9AGAR|nr:hypothetical protein GYMLUDRAFT_377538 [Collybiopsis luxurians FD-317 M1]